MPPLLHSHQKRALSEWPHPAYEWGQQQEVDVTIDRLCVILERPQAPTHLSAYAPSMCLFLFTSINKEKQVYYCFCGFFPFVADGCGAQAAGAIGTKDHTHRPHI